MQQRQPARTNRPESARLPPAAPPVAPPAPAVPLEPPPPPAPPVPPQSISGSGLVAEVRPKNFSISASSYDIECVAPGAVHASNTCWPHEFFQNWRFQLACDVLYPVSVDVGVIERPRTFVHSLIASPVFL